ncbi:MAG TPA: long-chain fatty acid--CoA ligase [Gemmatimonadales bacterium]|nr:long-chain fatty acid--CoA ligase [Gemmatimonadales bacterium]
MSRAIQDQPPVSPRRPAWAERYPPGVDWLLDIPVQPVPALLDEAARRFGARPFLDFLGRRYTYGETAALVTRAACGFQRMGVGKGVKVGLFLPNSPYGVVCYFAILKAGGTVVNYNPLYAERELIGQIQDSDTTILVTLDLAQLYDKAAVALRETRLRKVLVCRMAAALPASKRVMFRLTRQHELAKMPRNERHLSFDDLIDNDGAYDLIETAPQSDIAVLQYTGGTTGVPRGVMLSHQNIYANTCQIRSWYTRAVPGRERLLAILPFFHSFGMTGVMNFAVSLGGELVILPRFDPQETLRAIARKRVTMLIGVPTLFRALTECPAIARYDLSSLKISVSGGDALPGAVQEKFVRLSGCPLGEGYGLTECAPVAAATNPLEGIERPGSCGLPLPRTTVEIRSAPEPWIGLPVGEVGEICVSGPQVMLGYWRQPAATAECLSSGRLRTGDLGRLDADGFLYFVGRLKDVIAVHGYKVYPRIVEDAIRLHPGIADVAVVGVPDPVRGQAPKAYIVPAKGALLTEEGLRGFLADKLSPIEIPRSVEFRAFLPKSAAGKILKRVIWGDVQGDRPPETGGTE